MNLPEGYLLPQDEQFLVKVAKMVPDNGLILEIGAYKGRSAAILAENSKDTVRVISVDINDMTNYHPKVTFMIADSKRLEWNQPIDLLWIDGDHEFAGVYSDIQRFSEYLKPGGIICGHDFVWHEQGVIKAVQELILEQPEKWQGFTVDYHCFFARKRGSK